MANFTVLIKSSTGTEIHEYVYLYRAHECIKMSYKKDKHAKIYLHGLVAHGNGVFCRFRPRKPFDGSIGCYLKPVAPELLPPEAAFIHI